MLENSKAVFLSYASQDADAARRICDALRAAGVDVWFDQSELRGGDAWDAKIRKQIAGCALFVPVISAATQARREGYFRLEWRIAAQRTHMMSEQIAFLLPVVIDATRDAEADVPGEFKAVQWIRIGSADSLPALCERVKKLLGSELEPGRHRPGERGEGAASPTVPSPQIRVGRRVPAGAWIGGIAVVAIGAVATWIATLQSNAGAGTRPPALGASNGPPSQKATPSFPKTGDLAPAKSLAVLPFANLSADKENESFADSMHDELLTALAKIGDLKVISRTSVLIYRDPAKRNLTLRQIAAELGVANVLEGSVSRSGGGVRINVKLIDAATDQQRWAETFPLKAVTDVFQAQADISAQIAQSLAATFSPELKAALARKLTTNPAAYDLYLRARRWREMTRLRDLNTTAKWEEIVVRPLEDAIALDPKFAAAYAELGAVHSELYWFSFLDPTPARLARAKAAIDTAMRLEPSLPVAHLALGRYYYVGFLDYARATEALSVALAGMPGNADVLASLAATQRRQGRWADATANAERAFAVDPRNPEIPRTWVECLLYQRLYARAERSAGSALAIDPTNSFVLRAQAQARFAQDGDKARYQSALDAIPNLPGAEQRGRQFVRAFEDGRYGEVVRLFEESPEGLDVSRRGTVLGSPLVRYYFAATLTRDREKVRARARAQADLAATREIVADRRDEWIGVSNLAVLHAYAGLPDEARRLTRRMLELMPVTRDAIDGPRVLHEAALVHLVLGDNDRALALLDQALSGSLVRSANEILHLDPWWKPLHADPRFKAALAKAAPRD